eukprot:5665782-Pyramimonas_sp.AAC.1
MIRPHPLGPHLGGPEVHARVRAIELGHPGAVVSPEFGIQLLLPGLQLRAQEAPPHQASRAAN